MDKYGLKRTEKKTLLEHYRLTQEEYQLIEGFLGHVPSRLELALFSALWSEHCSYKSSAIHLKKFFFPSPVVLSASGENAGVVDLGKGEKAAFKIESHNHPSQIVPYHGAATGVGGILRDVFVMNARPIALADYLCFGSPAAESTAGLVDGVVQGIGGYGNSIGLPVITGQTEFHPSYNDNIVVNALALGYFGPTDEIMTSRARGPGNLLVYVGACTGKDGIHGASMASESFGEDEEGKKEDKKTCVQIGDPFYGKLLMEACLEVMEKKLVVAAQDMGAAGLISSSFEMISKGNLGMKLYLDRVPLRDSSMTPEEILLSESQERVLLLVRADQYNKLKEIFIKWGLQVCVIGELKKEKEVELFWRENLLVKINPEYLTEKAPRYNRPYSVWKPKYQVQNPDLTYCNLSNKRNLSDVLLSLLKDIRGNSRKFIYRQYDQRVGARTIKDCSFPFGVIRLPHSGRGLAVCMGGRPHIMRMDSLEGGRDAVYEPAVQLAARGFTPLALTDGLNFGSPEKKEVMSSFVACVEGLAEASRSLKTPVVSGNVSFYNETKGKGIGPSPATAMIGIKDSWPVPSELLLSSNVVVSPQLAPGEKTQLAPGEKTQLAPGEKTQLASGGKIYLVSAHQIFYTGLIGELYKHPPAFQGTLESEVCKKFIYQVLKTCLDAPPVSIQFVGKFGLAYTLARMLMDSSSGIEIKTDYDPFQERLYEIVVVLEESDVPFWNKHFSSASFPFKMEKLGCFIKEPVLSFNKNISLPISELKKAYQSTIFNFD